MLIYLGALELLFDALINYITIDGDTTFIFSVETSDTGSYQLLPTGRYAHGEQYVKNLCRSYGMSIIAKEQTMIRKERGNIIDGVIYLVHF